MAATESLSITLDKIRFRNEDNGFLIALGRTTGGMGATIKGRIISPQLGLVYHLDGRWISHPRFGRQFDFTAYRAELPVSPLAVRSYLAENAPNIGPVLSGRLIERYGNDALRILKDDPARVAAEIDGLTPDRAEEAARVLRAHEKDEHLHMSLRDLFDNITLSKRVMSRILEAWKHEAPDRIRANPFCLLEIEGIGFPTADLVANRIGFDKEHPLRIGAGIVHCLTLAAFTDGHSYMPVGLLTTKAKELLEIPSELVAGVMTDLVAANVLVLDGKHLYTRALYEAETSVAAKLQQLAANGRIPEQAHQPPDWLTEGQKAAVLRSLCGGVSIISGPPGTGKTTVVKEVLAALPATTRVALCAPTGRAARRIMEQTDRRASTIHMLLKPKPLLTGKGFVFEHSALNPLPVDLVIVDESSMIDIQLASSLLAAIPPNASLLLVGDVNQLPSVGPGNFLKDLIDSGIANVSLLDEIKRQGNGLIVRNCTRMQQGYDLDLEPEADEPRDLVFIPAETEEAISNIITALVSGDLHEQFGYELDDIQVISPLREKTDLSCKALNTKLSAALICDEAPSGYPFAFNDKVVQLRNDYGRGLVNGDIGYITAVDTERKVYSVYFDAYKDDDTATKEIPVFDNELALGWAVTVHKYQGSESPVVIIPVHRSMSPLLMQRPLLYTAISRASRLCVLVGHRDEVLRIINRNSPRLRYTRLAARLAAKES